VIIPLPIFVPSPGRGISAKEARAWDAAMPRILRIQALLIENMRRTEDLLRIKGDEIVRPASRDAEAVDKEPSR
jgi:hypothetical protein